jgi:hypothetical protein
MNCNSEVQTKDGKEEKKPRKKAISCNKTFNN